MRLYFDSNALIRLMEGVDDVADTLTRLFSSVKVKGRHTLITSDLSLAELLVRPLRTVSARPPETSEAAIAAAKALVGVYEDLFSSNALLPVGVDRAVLLRAAQVRAEFKSIKLPDAIHCASALVSECTYVVTGDVVFGQAAKYFGLDHLPLTTEALKPLLSETP